MATYPVIRRDADGRRFVIEVLTDDVLGEDGLATRNTAYGSIELKLSDLEGTNKEMKVREFKFLDKDNACSPMKCWVLMTEPEADS